MPVRQISTRPITDIRRTKRSISSVVPVSSNTKELSVASRVLAPKAAASRRASLRCSPWPATFTRQISRSIALPCSVRSTTRWTGTRRSSCALICSITAFVPVVTMVMRERWRASSVSETVRLSML